MVVMTRKRTNNYYLEIDESVRSSPESDVLPSQRSKGSSAPKRKTKTQVQMPKNLNMYIIILLIIILYFTYNQIILFFLEILKANPQLYSFYLYVEAQIANTTYTGLFAMAVLGSLFFLSLPSEILFIYYLSVGKSALIVFVVMVVGSLIGLAFNYFFGMLVGERLLKFMFKKNFEKYRNMINKYGGYLLFFGNIFPGPIELLSLFYGAFKYNFRYYLYLSMVGRAIKFGIILILYFVFWDQLLVYYDALIANFSVLGDFYGFNN